MTSPDLATFVTGYFVRHLAAERNVSAHTTAVYRDTLKLLLRFARDRTHRFRRDPSVRGSDPGADPAISRSLGGRSTQHDPHAQCPAGRDPQSGAVCRRLRARPRRRVPAGARHSSQEDHPSRARLSHRSRARAPPGAGGSVDLGRRTGLFAAGAAVRYGRTDSGVPESDARSIFVSRPAFVVASKGKGRRERLCPLLPQTARLVSRFLTHHSTVAHDHTPLVSNRRRDRLTRHGARYLLMNILRRARASMPSLNRRGISPHTFRHYLPFLTMSSDIMTLSRWISRFRSQRGAGRAYRPT